MSSNIAPRILKETQRLNEDPIQGIIVEAVKDNYRHFKV